LLEARAGLGLTPGEGFGPVGQVLLATEELLTTALELFLPRVQPIELTIERVRTFLCSTLSSLRLFPAAALFDFPGFAEAKSFFATRQLTRFACVLGFAFSPLEDAGGLVLSLRLL
jgi:hypothetical protein